MPADERLERCDRHPGSPAVAVCDGCGRPMCLACSTPVRGQAYGAECLVLVLGPDAPTGVEPPPRPAGATARTVAVLGFALATLATALPWSRFGPGADALGAWTRSGRWSVVAGVAALLGLGLSIVQRASFIRTPGWDAVAVVLGAVVALASVLAIALPPEFTEPWLGPWVTAVAGSVACGAAVVAARAGTPTTVSV